MGGILSSISSIGNKVVYLGKKLVETDLVLTSMGLGYLLGAGGALLVDTVTYGKPGLEKIPVYFSYGLSDGIWKTVGYIGTTIWEAGKHANEVGGGVAAMMGSGTEIFIYKFKRR